MQLRIRWLGMIALVAGGALVLGATPAERKIFTFGSITIEASPGDDAYVQALARQLAEPRPATAAVSAPPPPDGALTLARLVARRDYFLAKACAWLALDRPTEKMIFAFDTMPELWRQIAALPDAGRPSHFALWHREDLRARIEAGEKVPGFKADGKGGLEFGFDFNFDLQAEDSPETMRAKSEAIWRDVVWPVRITGAPGETPDAAAAEAIQAFGRYAEMIDTMRAAQLQHSQVFNVLHETVESGIVWTYLTSRDRRWFCDGVANYVAWKIIEQEAGADAARAYYDLPAELAKFAADAPHIDLAAWPAAEDAGRANYSERLNTADYAFATKVIADICAKHGDKLLPRLFAEVGRTKREKADLDTVRKAFRKLTGEDLDSYLPNARKRPAK